MYYEILPDGTIGRSTTDADLAQSLGLALQTDREAVYASNGKRYFKGTEPPPRETSYAEKRAKAYPSIADQLDMMYWDKINGTDTWREAVCAVKIKYPKE